MDLHVSKVLAAQDSEQVADPAGDGDNRRLRADDLDFGSPKPFVCEQVVSNDLWVGIVPGTPCRRDCIGTAPPQRPLEGKQATPRSVIAAHHRICIRRVITDRRPRRQRRTGSQILEDLPRRGRWQDHVRVQVDPWEDAERLVGRSKCGGLGRSRYLENLHGWPRRPNNVCGAVGASVARDHDVKLAWGKADEQRIEATSDGCCFIEGWDYHGSDRESRHWLRPHSDSFVDERATAIIEGAFWSKTGRSQVDLRETTSSGLQWLGRGRIGAFLGTLGGTAHCRRQS